MNELRYLKGRAADDRGAFPQAKQELSGAHAEESLTNT